jgi:polysaccharide biosynthesis transport protein
VTGSFRSVDEPSEIGEYLGVLRSRKWTIIRVLVAALAATAAFTALQHPVYQATAEVLLTSTSSSAGSGANNTVGNLNTEKAIITSPSIAGPVKRQLGLATSETALENHVKVLVPSGATILNIVYDDRTGADAARIANAFADVYVRFKADQAQSALGAATASLKAQITKVEGQLLTIARALPQASSPGAIVALKHQRLSLQADLLDLQSKLTEASLTEQTAAKVIKPATAPSKPISPNWKRNVLAGLAAGLALGIILAFAGDARDDRIKSRRELQQLSGVPTLAEIPWVEAWASRKGAGVHPAAEMPRGPVGEAYQALAVNISYLSSKQPARVIVVTSAVPGEGKSTTAANLAVTLAQLDRSVCLVDLNLTAPVLHEMFALSDEGGISAVLSESRSLEAATLPTSIPNLQLIPAGVPGPDLGKLAVAFRDGGYLDRLAEANDYVILDTPAVRSAEIAPIVAPATDGTLVVVNPNGLVATDLRSAVTELRATGATLLGTIENGIRPGRAAYLDETPET